MMTNATNPVQWTSANHLLTIFIVGILAVLANAEPKPEGSPEPTLLPALAPYHGPTRSDVDASNLRGRVLCGYQGWFRAKGDGVVNLWHHWSIDANRITSKTLTVEMWPDMREYPSDARFPVEGLKNPDGTPAELFSSLSPDTVDLHFRWMRDYGIEGVFVQRFLVTVKHPNTLQASGALAYSRNAAHRYGRVFAVTYDMSSFPENRLYDALVSDWKFLVDSMQITRDSRYLHHNGKPVLMIWGFFPNRMKAETAGAIIDFFRNDPRYGVTLVGGVPWPWRNVSDPGWSAVFRKFDVISPWNTGNCSVSREDGTKKASTSAWTGDIAEAHHRGMLYMPVVYPGFSWINLKRARGKHIDPNASIPRRDGAFFWEQFERATQIKADSVYIAMFDEVDEGTAILKVTSTPPIGVHAITYGDRPTDWYLRLAGLGTRLFHETLPAGEIPFPTRKLQKESSTKP